MHCEERTSIRVSYVGYEPIKIGVEDFATVVEISLTPSSHLLNEIEISETPIQSKELLEQPASVVKLNNTEIKRGTDLFLDDAINTNIPGVFMQRRTISAGQQFNIRGYVNGVREARGASSNFDTQGSKIYLNGIPITDAEGITTMDDIDFGTIRSVEIIKGPAGSLYGLAIAGVVNLKTQQANKKRSSVGHEFLLGSYGLKRNTTRLQLGGEKAAVWVSYGKQEYEGFMHHTASKKEFITITGDFNLNSKQSINTFISYSNSYDQRNGELTVTQYNALDYSGNINYIANDAHSSIISFRAGVSHTYKIMDKLSNTTTVFGSGINSNSSSAGGWTDRLPIN